MSNNESVQGPMDPVEMAIMGASPVYFGMTAERIAEVLEKKRLANLDCSIEGLSPAMRRERELGTLSSNQVARVTETE